MQKKTMITIIEQNCRIASRKSGTKEEKKHKTHELN